MRNGYAICSRDGLNAINELLQTFSAVKMDDLRRRLRIGVHSDVEITAAADLPGPLVSQAFCSALPVAYTAISERRWRPFATLALEAAYEATMWAAVINANRGASNIVFLTLLGSGAFGNDEEWILGAMRRAIEVVASFDLDIRVVCHRTPSRAVVRFVDSIG